MSILEIDGSGSALSSGSGVAAVMEETWGHLAPKAGKRYKGTILWCFSAWGGDIVLVDAKFEGLDGSPWLHDDLCDYIFEATDSRTMPKGGVYKFTGTYRPKKNGPGVFEGAIERVPIP